MLEKLQQKKVLVLAMLGVVLALCTVGHLAILLRPNDCSHDKAFINRYNSRVREKGMSGLQSTADELAQKKIDNDATCLYVKMVVEYGDMKNAGELQTYQQLKLLEAKGQQVSPEINDGLNRDAMETIIRQEIDDQTRGVDASG